MTKIKVAADPKSVLEGSLEIANYFGYLSGVHHTVVNIERDVNLGSSVGGILVDVEGDKYRVKDKKDAARLFVQRVILKKDVEDLKVKKVLPPEKAHITEEVLIVKRNFGRYEDIDGYLALGGYEALKKALKMKPEQVVEEIKESGLRGRGGAGFPTGLKWESALKEKALEKFVVCNADEGEPGTFKDRVIIEEDPHALVEGMIISAYAVGASKGYIYIRGEYADVARKLQKAIEEAEAKGFLGEDILGSGFNFQLVLRFGGGSYIAGEETALLESIEGRAARSRFKPPYPTQKGLFGKPTVVNNVETLVKVPWIILHGGAEYRKYGTESSPGTKLFSICGIANKRHVVELPLGVTLRELVYAYGEGVYGEGKLAMVQTGGKAGTFVPPEKLDVKLDFDAVKEGVSLGSGAIVLIDDSSSFLDIALNVAKFFEHESCGKCTPCREGMFLMRKMIEKMVREGKEDYDALEEIERIVLIMKDSSLCGLGQSVHNPMISLIRILERGEVA